MFENNEWNKYLEDVHKTSNKTIKPEIKCWA